MSTVQIRCVVTRLYPKSSPKWSAGTIRLEDGREAKFQADFGLVQGEQAHLQGRWHDHPKFGRQFKAEEIVWDGAVGSAGIVLWLAETVPGVGRVKAERAGKEFGENLELVLMSDVEKLAKFLGIPAATLNEHRNHFMDRRNHVAMIGELVNCGVPSKLAARIVDELGDAGVRMLKADPYSLIGRIDRFGWKTVDESIARKLGIGLGDPRRIRAAIRYCFYDAAEGEGHTCLTKTDFVSRMDKILDMGRDVWLETVQAINADESLIVNLPENRVAYHTIHECELEVARRLNENTTSDPEFQNPNRLEEKQLEALITAMQNTRMVMTGGAGCGKTFVIKSIVDCIVRSRIREDVFTGENCIRCGRSLSDHSSISVGVGPVCAKYMGISPLMTMQGYNPEDDLETYAINDPVTVSRYSGNVLLCAPTGKAAKRLEEVTGHPAQTIHKMLGMVPGQPPIYSEQNPIRADAVIVDEVSMCDIFLMRSLLRAIAEPTKLIMVGDPYQLPSVGAGSVLRDVAASGSVPHVHLDRCHRQAGVLKENCYAILSGDTSKIQSVPKPEDGSLAPWIDALNFGSAEAVLRGLKTIYAERLPAYGLDTVADVQLITPTNKGPLGTRRLNIWIQSILRGTPDYWEGGDQENDVPTKYKYTEGDKVIWLQNDYSRSLMNGDMGVVVKVNSETEATVRWGDGELRDVPTTSGDLMALGYALTAHKFQGSQVPVAIVIASSVHSSWGMKNIVNRSWSYTAATRSQKTTILIGDRRGWESMLSREQTDKRQTYLADALRGGDDD